MSSSFTHYNGIDMSQRGWGFYPTKEDEWDWLKIVDGKLVAYGRGHPEFEKDLQELTIGDPEDDSWSYETIMGETDCIELDGDIVELVGDNGTSYRFWVEDISKVISILHKVHKRYLENKENEHI